MNSLSPLFADKAAFWHLLWLIGLTAVVGLVAVARHRRDRPWRCRGGRRRRCAGRRDRGHRSDAFGLGRRIADRVASPERHQVCAAADGPVDVCVYRFHRALLGPVTDEIGPVAAALPAGMARLTLRQAFPGDLGDLPPEVRRRLTASDLGRPAGEVALGFGHPNDDVLDGPGFHLALTSLGLPPERAEIVLPTVIAGQARGVVAMWLATRAAAPPP